MDDQRFVSVTGQRIESALLSTAPGSNEHFVVEDQTERRGRSMVVRKVSRKIG